MLLRGAVRHRDLFLLAQRVIQIGSCPLELRRPRGQRIGIVVVQHVPHGQREGVEIVLNAKELQRIPAVAINQVILQLAKT